MKKLVYLLLFVRFVSFSQDYGNKTEALKLCSDIQNYFSIEKEANNYVIDKEAEQNLDKILSVIGASRGFVLQPCENINNAVAISDGGIRYILYDKDFMNSINSENNWSNLFILAHEVGHHLNGHTLSFMSLSTEELEPESLANQRQQELEADEFSGFILAKLGGTLKQTLASIEFLSTNEDDTYSTHPSKSKRLAAIKKGYNNETYNYQNTEAQKAELFIYSGLSKYIQNDYEGALTDFNEAIGLIPNVPGVIFFARGTTKYDLKDYYGAIADFTKSIALDPNVADAYYNRGFIKANFKDYKEALADFSKAIEIDPNLAVAYNNRGIVKRKLKDYKGATADYNKAIEINPNDDVAYYNRGISNEELEDYYGAILDYTKAIEVNTNYAKAYYNRGNLRAKFEDYKEAIADYTKSIEINPNKAESYHNRSAAKYYLDDYNGACQDARKAQKLGIDASALIEAACN